MVKQELDVQVLLVLEATVCLKSLTQRGESQIRQDQEPIAIYVLDEEPDGQFSRLRSLVSE